MENEHEKLAKEISKAFDEAEIVYTAVNVDEDLITVRVEQPKVMVTEMIMAMHDKGFRRLESLKSARPVSFDFGNSLEDRTLVKFPR